MRLHCRRPSPCRSLLRPLVDPSPRCIPIPTTLPDTFPLSCRCLNRSPGWTSSTVRRPTPEKVFTKGTHEATHTCQARSSGQWRTKMQWRQGRRTTPVRGGILAREGGGVAGGGLGSSPVHKGRVRKVTRHSNEDGNTWHHCSLRRGGSGGAPANKVWRRWLDMLNRGSGLLQGLLARKKKERLVRQAMAATMR
jgi:hypothetical protein